MFLGGDFEDGGEGLVMFIDQGSNLLCNLTRAKKWSLWRKRSIAVSISRKDLFDQR